MTLICGADGCRAGWITIGEEFPAGGFSWRVASSLTELAGSDPKPDLITIDVPIGLPDRGARECDTTARKLLGPRRRSSVFPAPIRAVLESRSHSEACTVGDRLEGKKLSLQAWAIVRKIREVDQALRDDLIVRARVREVHPEVCFYYMAGGRPMAHSKTSKEGRQERRDLLESHFDGAVHRALAERRTLRCSEDDMLDAFAALWTARRIVQGQALTLPSQPPRDRFDLPMEMVA